VAAWERGRQRARYIKPAAPGGLFASLVADTAPEDLRGTAFGVFNFAGGIAMLIASVLAGGLWDAYGPSATYLCGAALTLVALIGLVLSHRRNQLPHSAG